MLFFKEKKVLRAVAKGQIIPLAAVKDQVFSSKMMGEGYAIIGHDGHVHSPVEGMIENIFPTYHAITIGSKSGEKVLIHMGIDTVELKGAPFSIHVTTGQKVDCGTLLAEMDLQQLVEAKKDATIIVVSPDLSKGKLLKTNQQVSIQDDCYQF
ncbi:MULTISPECIES: PTS glucose transporter subunit IIA [Enterococcus]|uniref:PTS glucose transporter subunit IIA n=1 Tax=Enterococcus TaxID=1350 RepID=UPI0001B6D86C|nr:MULTISPECIES: PTS glucose transporter subunit IIA [Enterococcus]EEV29806.1 sugar-specific permease [Enterococcus casseliflavus EC30]EEV35650.1 sugar-specific permease [Enterococcus casseliflavus EC10]MDO0895910.1 PTS glucose transporter subunit IIA [Enterococcus sp. B1E4]MDO0908698.1 PTS glucose transporter subunit IIA [Enterococcus sp. B2E4]